MQIPSILKYAANNATNAGCAAEDECTGWGQRQRAASVYARASVHVVASMNIYYVNFVAALILVDVNKKKDICTQ